MWVQSITPFYKFFKFNNSSLFTKDDSIAGSEDEDDDDDDESESFCEVAILENGLQVFGISSVP